MDIMTHANLHFNQLMLTLMLTEPSLGPGERLKRPSFIGIGLGAVFVAQNLNIKVFYSDTILFIKILQ